jgi:hypothetical protein
VKDLVQEKKGREESSQLRHLIGGQSSDSRKGAVVDNCSQGSPPFNASLQNEDGYQNMEMMD